MNQEPRPLPAEDAERLRVAKALSEAGFCLPGSIGDEHTRCGKPNCRCKADPPIPHGPYHHWTRKIGGKTVGRYLSDEQLDRYRDWFEQARRLRDLLGELETLSLRIAERAEGWDPQAPPTGHRPRSGGKPSETDPTRQRRGRRRLPDPIDPPS
ncbi:MAG: DUF6788 family protein [Candidatus Dormibacteria bacterium]